MADPFSWGDLGHWSFSVFRRQMPERVLRWGSSAEKLLTSVEAFHFNQAPHFFVRPERDNPELNLIGFNVFNLSPFKLTIVGADVRIVLDSRDFLTYQQRFPSESPVAAFARGGFIIQYPLGESHVKRLRAYPSTHARIRIEGGVFLRTPFGEQRKSLSADIIALIDR